MALNIRRFFEGLQVVPKTTSTVDTQGEMDVTIANGKLNYHNGTSASPVVTEVHASQGTNRLKNKDVEDSSFAVVDASDTTKKLKFNAAGTTGTSTTLLGSQTTDKVLTLPDATDTLIGKATTDTLTNKSLSDSTTAIVDVSDPTKQILFDASGTTGTSTTLLSSQTSNKVLTLPNATDTLIGKATTDILSNKTLDNSTILTIKDVNLTIQDDADISKQAKFDASGISSSTTRTFIFPNANTTLVGTDAIQILTNKTLSGNTASNLINGAGTFNFNSSGTLTAPNATDTLVGKATTDTFTNKTPGQNWIPDNNTRDLGSSGIPWNNEYLAGFIDATQMATPTSPSSSHDRLYFKSDNNLYSLDSNGNEKLIGSGSSLSTNFIGLNASFQPVNSNDKDAEATIGNWATYSSGTTTPITMTGGSATQLTLSRTTVAGEVLNGAGSFKIVKAASNAQGQGVSVLTNVPVGYRGQVASIQIPFKIISGSLVSGDLKFFVEDVTNSTIITPSNNDVLVSQSILLMSFNVASNIAQIRVGFHFASTSTNAVTFTWDDVYVGPQQLTYGAVMTDWIPYTPTFTGFGTPSNTAFFYRRNGDSMDIIGQFTSGTSTAVTGKVSLPSGYTADTKLTGALGTDTTGAYYRDVSTSNTVKTGGIKIVNTDSTLRFLNIDYTTSGSGPFDAGLNGNVVAPGTDNINLYITSIPILNWSANVVTSNSQTFNISSILANGTRVTGSSPTVLGQYRSQLRNANVFTFTDTNGAPASSPSGTDGIKLYSGNAFTSADTNNQPTRYEIFIGKNKSYRLEFYKSTGRTGFMDVSPVPNNGNSDNGEQYDYDPTTGIFWIQGFRFNVGATTHQVGLNDTGGTQSTGFFDIIVSDNILGVQSYPVHNEVTVNNGNGYGSINDKIRRYTNSSTIGSAITYADSATLGATFTVNATGVYSIDRSDAGPGPSDPFGISLNSNQLTTSITGITASAILQLSTANNADRMSVSCTKFLNAGDVIRAHDAGTLTSTSNTSFLRITKVF